MTGVTKLVGVWWCETVDPRPQNLALNRATKLLLLLVFLFLEHSLVSIGGLNQLRDCRLPKEKLTS